MDVRGLARQLFGMEAPVNRRLYLVAGFVLMALKFAVDNAIVYAATGEFWSPLAYFNPIFTMREGGLQMSGAAQEWFTPLMAAWALPFVWVGVSMSIRRARDAGLPGLFGLLFFVPIVNFLVIALLGGLPSRMVPATAAPRAIAEQGGQRLTRSVLLGLGVGVGSAVVMTAVSTLVVGAYGGALFMGTPFLIGFFSAWFLNKEGPQPMARTMLAMTLALCCAGAALMLFALEGLLCLLMAFPLAWLLGALGAFAGRTVALQSRLDPRGTVALLVSLPILLGFEASGGPAPEHEVITAVEIDAPPQVVWENIVGWTEMPQDDLPWYFAMGVAYPQRARLVGTGVGAVRYCEFSTGAFVEPITVWDEPRRLAFDVVSQPPTMHEWSPWERIHAPHLDGFMVSHRGEFRLVELPGGRTRLEGSTWYHLDMFPQAYWTLYSDWLLHAIHRRVLDHIGDLAQAAHTGR